jgi:hypothetical protein
MPVGCTEVTEGAFSTILPSAFGEYLFRVYTKKPEYVPLKTPSHFCSSSSPSSFDTSFFCRLFVPIQTGLKALLDEVNARVAEEEAAKAELPLMPSASEMATSMAVTPPITEPALSKQNSLASISGDAGTSASVSVTAGPHRSRGTTHSQPPPPRHGQAQPHGSSGSVVSGYGSASSSTSTATAATTAAKNSKSLSRTGSATLSQSGPVVLANPFTDVGKDFFVSKSPSKPLTGPGKHERGKDAKRGREFELEEPGSPSPMPVKKSRRA